MIICQVYCKGLAGKDLKNKAHLTSLFIGLIGSEKRKGRDACIRETGVPPHMLVSVCEGKRDPHGTACMSHYVVSWCRAEPIALLIKASLSRVSGSFSFSADFFPHSAARTASGFNQQRLA